MNDYDKQIAEIYREMELEIIRSMKKNLGLHLAEEKKTGIKYPQWQAIKLKELKRYQRQNLKIIQKHTLKLSDEVSKQMQNELKQGSRDEYKRYAKVNKKFGISGQQVKDSFLKIDPRKVSAQINDLTNSLKTANTAVFRMSNDAYREVIFKYSLFASNGVYTEKQAYDQAVKDFLERGLNCIEYKDGRRVNIASYAQMAVRTASQRAYMTGQGEFRKKLGRTLIQISKHNTSCPLCQPFERKVLIDDVYSGGTEADGDYMLLSQAMKEGLYHPNCRHGSAIYFSELGNDESESKAGESEDKSSKEKAHADSMVQKYKRLSEGSVDPENIKNYRQKLSKWEEKSKKLNKSVENAQNGDIMKVGSELTQSLTHDDEAILRRWVSSESYGLNEKLRNMEDLTDNDKKFIADLDTALSKLPDYEGILYRSIDSSGIDDIAAFRERHTVGETVTYAQYTSASADVYDETMDIQFVIKSKRAKDITKINPDEKEYLFKRNSKFKVTKAENNTIYLEEE